ncbi:hypothetical protein Rsub_10044 [Raphidocelis subcapitata]|uniref:RNA-binding S4 domain-containing protein n=1 Tax=Raphidocelis subcapitata TaxID=307507 RepID=A0A2V0PGY9_9CHLO|nr:hypothetical protein Rsub_10044 [Raphidocelis subcapitata]|eukprot:GBF97183.1 hypothetical protein Rsub_10044 [Raphidocelis subcapitata]
MASFARQLRARGWSCVPITPSTSAAAPGLGAPRGAPRRAVTAAAAAGPQRARELAAVAPENRQEVAGILDLAEQAARGWELRWSRFVTPPVAADALAAVSQLAEVSAMAWGGYPQAERCRIVIGREELLAPARADPASALDCVAAVDVRGNFMFDPASHRDFLGALLGTGVVREVVGDVLVQGEGGAQVLVRSVPVEARRVALSELRVPPAQASLRLDAVASAGFRMGRGAMADLIKSGDVRLQWREVKKPSVEVKEGDVISVAGKGRVTIKGVEQNKKGKFVVKYERLL